MAQRYADKVTIITGGANGIGEACVRQFVKNGAKVIICDNDVEAGTALEKELNKIGDTKFIVCDMTKEEDIKNMVEKTVEIFGRIDCLLNNVGRNPPLTTIDDFSGEQFMDVMRINVLSYFLASKYALPHIRKTKGNIINVSSLLTITGMKEKTAYVTSKCAIDGLTRAMAVDEAKYQVRVNMVKPGAILTPLQERFAAEMGDKEAALQDLADLQLMGRLGMPEEIANACVFIAAEGTFMTGAALPITGGAELNMGVKSRISEKKVHPLQ